MVREPWTLGNRRKVLKLFDERVKFVQHLNDIDNQSLRMPKFIKMLTRFSRYSKYFRSSRCSRLLSRLKDGLRTASTPRLLENLRVQVPKSHHIPCNRSFCRCTSLCLSISEKNESTSFPESEGYDPIVEKGETFGNERWQISELGWIAFSHPRYYLSYSTSMDVQLYGPRWNIFWNEILNSNIRGTFFVTRFLRNSRWQNIKESEYSRRYSTNAENRENKFGKLGNHLGLRDIPFNSYTSNENVPLRGNDRRILTKWNQSNIERCRSEFGEFRNSRGVRCVPLERIDWKSPLLSMARGNIQGRRCTGYKGANAITRRG